MSDSKPKNTSNPAYFFAVGRRKSAIARIRLHPPYSGSEKQAIVVNDKPIKAYFRLSHAEKIYLKPLQLTKSLNRFKISAKITGSGPQGQIDAFVHALSRALVKVDEDFKTTLKQAGLLTRDPRSRQRRMIGTGGKARRQKQSPKR